MVQAGGVNCFARFLCCKKNIPQTLTSIYHRGRRYRETLYCTSCTTYDSDCLLLRLILNGFDQFEHRNFRFVFLKTSQVIPDCHNRCCRNFDFDVEFGNSTFRSLRFLIRNGKWATSPWGRRNNVHPACMGPSQPVKVSVSRILGRAKGSYSSYNTISLNRPFRKRPPMTAQKAVRRPQRASRVTRNRIHPGRVSFTDALGPLGLFAHVVGRKS